MSRFRGAWQSLNFDQEYLFEFDTLVFATSGILSIHNQFVTLQRERKTSHHMTPLTSIYASQNKNAKLMTIFKQVSKQLSAIGRTK